MISIIHDLRCITGEEVTDRQHFDTVERYKCLITLRIIGVSCKSDQQQTNRILIM